MLQFKSKPPKEPPLLRIGPFRGINLSVTPTQIHEYESPDILNMNLDERGALNKRTGYERIYPTSLGAGKINGLHIHRKADGTSVFLIHHGTKLYTQSGSDQPVEIYASMANAKSKSFSMNGKTYFLEGANYLVYDGTTVVPVTPYIPTLTVSTPPAGGGTALEDFNLIGAGFKQKFSGNGTDKVFQLALTSLDNTPIIVKVDGVTKTLTTDYTVDFTLGKVTFVTAPVNGTNNVEITAYKTQTGFADRIKKCTFATLFGGNNDTRPFVSGNPDFPNYVWRLGLYDPTYAPENGFYKVGNDGNKIQGFAKQYDYLVIEKEASKHVMRYELNGGNASFPIKQINDQTGTYARDSIQIIDNNPASLTKKGVYLLVASNVKDERNVEHISTNVDDRLLSEPNLDKAISYDFNRRYWLCVNGNVYLFDYSLKEWLIYDNIHASCFLEMNGELYFGSDSQGIVYRFKRESEQLPYNDDGAAINAYWKSKQFAFGADERRKLVDRVFYTLKPSSKTSVDLYYVTNKKQSELVKTIRMDSFDFRTFDFATLTFFNTIFPQEVMAKIKAKKVTHFQMYLKNNKVDESMGIQSLGIKYRYQSEVK